MKLEYDYRSDCDILRLLVDEFERMSKRYEQENEEKINSIMAYDASQYHAPRYIPNLKELLTSSLLIQIQSLLDFSLPKVVEHLSKSKNLAFTPFNEASRGRNVLCWVKDILRKEIKSSFNFGNGLYSRLRDFYKIRNDQVHHGGYLSAENRRVIVNKLNGVHISQYTDLYDTNFSYCRSVIDDAEKFLIEVEKSISIK